MPFGYELTVPYPTAVDCIFSLHRFLLQSLEDLDNSLRKLNSRLFVVRGQPTDVFPRLFKVSLQMREKLIQYAATADLKSSCY